MPTPRSSLSGRETLVLVVLLLVAAWLRFAGLGQGIPFAIGVDEPEILERAVRMMKTGDFHPDFFDYPTLYIYLQTGVAVLRFMTGAMAGLWATLDQAPSSEFYLWGRAVTATLGTATVALVFLIGRRIGLLAASVGALLLAVQPMHVRESHFILTDVPMTFFATLAMLLTLRAFDRATPRAYAWPGVAAGLAAATKYHGGSVLLLPLLSLLLRRGQPDRLRSAGAAIAGAAAAFLVFAPYTVLDLPAFLNKFGTLSHMYAVGPAAIEPAWITYLKHLRNNLGWPALLLAGASLLWAVRETWRGEVPGRDTPGAAASVRATWATLAVFVVLTFWLVAGQRLIYARYLLPILPPLAVLMGGTLAALAGAVASRLASPAHRRWATTALVVLAAGWPAWLSVDATRLYARTGTAELAYRWILAEIPAGAHVAVESRGLLLPRDHYATENLPTFAEFDLDHYRAEGYEYLVASSQAFGPPLTATPPNAATRAYRQLFDRLQLLTAIVPTADHPGAEWRVYRLPD
ncbi:MAG: phospholipid carrier-dependent glycosyltransferase [Vicinamibacterales bacterium]